MVDDWLRKGLQAPLDAYKPYLTSRGVDSQSSISFHSWSPHDHVEDPRFKSMFGNTGERIKDHLIIPVTSPRGQIIGLEVRSIDAEGQKKVLQYRTHHTQWNPYLLGCEKAFNALWEGNDLWIVEGVFDLIAVEKVVHPHDAVCSTLRAGMDSNTLSAIAQFYTPLSTIYICYDNDETGRKKSSWLHKQMTSLGIRCVEWKYRGKDPNEVWKAGGIQALKKLFY